MLRQPERLFLFRLAAHLGKTVGQLLHDLEKYKSGPFGGLSELLQWQAFSRIERFGYEMENFRMGVIASTVANVAPRRGRPLKPSDFYPSRRAIGPSRRQQRLLADQKPQRPKG